MAGKYEAEGTGIHDWITRDRIYTGVIVIGGAIIAALITLGIISLDDVQGYITLTVTVIGVLGGVVGMITAALAKANVAPNDNQHADYLD
jgi:heme/copper-type cytochrome/quinol oxidase subunit 2